MMTRQEIEKQIDFTVDHDVVLDEFYSSQHQVIEAAVSSGMPPSAFPLDITSRMCRVSSDMRPSRSPWTPITTGFRASTSERFQSWMRSVKPATIRNPAATKKNKGLRT